ncbi:MAG TPA: pentapeptide repeat-containing protein [Micromonosporaceae bacterium]
MSRVRLGFRSVIRVRAPSVGRYGGGVVRRLPQWTLLVVFGLAVVAGIVALVFAPAWLYPPLTDAELRGVTDAEKRITLQQAQSQLQNDARATLLQGLAGLVVVAGAAATWQQVQISRHGQITDRMTKAVDQLGEGTVDVRLGGLYALERVAKDSYEDRATVTTILVAFVRTHAPVHSAPGPREAGEADFWLGIRAPDVQAALTVLGRRPETDDDREIYLSHTDLRKARLVAGRWDGLVCAYSNLAGARMRNASLFGAVFDHSDLRGASLSEAVLVDASLRHASLVGARLRDADLRGADLTGANLDGADLTAVRTDARTIWPDGFNPAPHVP